MSFFRSYHLPVLSAEQNDSHSFQCSRWLSGRKLIRHRAGSLNKMWNFTKTKSRQSNRKASTTSTSINTENKSRKFSWTPETVAALLKYTKEYKTKCEFSGVDFEADLQSLYTEVRRCMAIDNLEDFGPEASTISIRARCVEQFSRKPYWDLESMSFINKRF